MYAQTHYHIWGLILYEGMHNKGDFYDDLEKQVLPVSFKSLTN